MVTHAVEVNGVPLPVRLGQHPVDPSACAFVHVVEIVLHIVHRELFFIIVVETGDAPTGQARPVRPVDFRVPRRTPFHLLITVRVAYHDRFVLVPLRRITVAVLHEARLDVIPFLHLLQRIRRQIFLPIIRQTIIRLPDDHARIATISHHHIAVVLPFIGNSRFVLQCPFIVAAVDDQQDAVAVASLEHFRERRLVPHTQRITAAPGYPGNIVPPESRRNGSPQSRVIVPVTEAAQKTFLTVDIAKILVPRDLPDAPRTALPVHQSSVHVNFILHRI